MGNPTDIFDMLIQGTLMAINLHMKDRGLDMDEHAGDVAEEAKALLKAELTNFVMGDLKECMGPTTPEAGLRELMNAQCNLWALTAIKAVEARMATA